MDLAAWIGGARLLAAAWWIFCAASRFASVLAPGRRDVSESLLLRLLLAIFLGVLSVVLLAAVGALHGTALLILSAAVFGISRITVARRDARDPFFRGRLRSLWPVLPALVLVLFDLVVFLPASPSNWDAMTYHLFFPARWIQDGELSHIPTFFGDDAPAYAPQNGALFFAWQMALLGSDATANVAQVLSLAMMVLVLYRLALFFGGRRESAVMAAVLVFFLLPLRRWTWSANVDIFMIACWLAGVYWTISYVDKPARGSLLAGGLALGLAVGTKVLGLPLAAIPAAVVIAFLLYRKDVRSLGLFFFSMVAGGGWWYLRNGMLYGNPLFPLDTVFFSGVYPSEALFRGHFRIDDLGRWLELVRSQFALPTLVLAAAGLLGLVRAVRRRRVATALFLFALGWGGYVFSSVPHNSQTRFLIPALVLALLGWSRWFEACASRGGRAALFAVVLGVAVLGSRPDQVWTSHLPLLDLGWPLAALAALAAIVWTITWTVWRSGGVLVPLSAVLCACLLWPLVSVAAGMAGSNRALYLARADYLAWADGYLILNDPALAPRRIAYAGLNVPYTLVGPGFRHRVSYCNTQGRESDGLYEFWRRDPILSGTDRPGLYRGAGRDAFDVWWRCLERRKIDTVVLFATIPVERAPHWRSSGPFPIERGWIRERPELFRGVHLAERAEIYEVLRSP